LGDTIDVVTDVKQVKNTTIINKNDVFDRENNIAASIEKIKTIERMNIANQRIRNTFKDYTTNTPNSQASKCSRARFCFEASI